MIWVLSQLFTANCDQIIYIERLSVNIGRSEEILLLPFKISHHLRLGLWEVRQIFLDFSTGTILPLRIWLCKCALHSWRALNFLTIFVLALFSWGGTALKHGRI